MREKFFAIGDDFWIEDADANKVFKVNGKAVRLRDTFILEDAHGNELCKIQEKKLSVRDKMTIESGSTQATVHKRLIGIRDHYVIDVDGGEDLKAREHRRSRVRDRARRREDRRGLQEVVPRARHHGVKLAQGPGRAAHPRCHGGCRSDGSRVGPSRAARSALGKRRPSCVKRADH